jgi:omega-amidase
LRRVFSYLNRKYPERVRGVKISCIQMNVRAGQPERNFLRAEMLVRRAARKKPDVILLPELWNTGFSPENIDPALADEDGRKTKSFFSALAKQLGVNIVAGSVANRKRSALCNTAYVFSREGDVVAEYDKTHLFTPMGEPAAFSAGDTLARFQLDGVPCGVMICYDIRFPELARALALPGLDVLFVVAQWPLSRTGQLRTLLLARAIENQAYAALCNGCGRAAGIRYGGRSAIVSPRGKTLSKAGGGECTISAHVDLCDLARLRSELPVWKDRRPELYGALCGGGERHEDI